ncbi:MAG: zinc-binding dehydrogenase [Deltaproteobacteria bacterium]|nr:zinc-binding dehydrogenase [Deltaproteobacteria bacterium]
MKAIVLNKGGGPEVLKQVELPDPAPGPGQALVRLKAAGLNHRDLYQRRAYTGPEDMILGSDGAGLVEAVGHAGDEGWVGREVVINPGLHWGAEENAQGPGFQILGYPSWGTYAEAVLVPVENLLAKPGHLSFSQAAALPLAGLTAWRALFTRGGLQPGQTVLLPGIGGGVAGLALVFARMAGARVIVTSSSREKLELAAGEGASHGVNYLEPDWEDAVRDLAGPGGIDLVLDHTGQQTLPASVRLVRPGGAVVFFGSHTGTELKLNLREMFLRQVRLIGSYMGSPREFREMFRFVDVHRYTPRLRHVYPLESAGEAHQLMEDAGQFGKIILEP